jgi:hypothetical protein
MAFELGAEGSAVGPYRYEVATGRWWWSAEMGQIHGVPAETAEPTTGLLLEQVHPEDRDAVRERLEGWAGEPGPYSWAYRVVDARRRVRSIVHAGEAIVDGGMVIRLEGFCVDISEPVSQSASLAVEASAANRAAIEQVKGALMLTYGISDDAAYSLLRGYSNNHNVRLSAMARDIVDRLSSPDYRHLAPRETLLAIITDVVDRRSVGRPRRTEPMVLEGQEDG